MLKEAWPGLIELYPVRRTLFHRFAALVADLGQARVTSRSPVTAEPGHIRRVPVDLWRKPGDLGLMLIQHLGWVAGPFPVS